MSPVGWKPRAREQFSAGKMRICNSGTVAGQCQIRSGMHPFGWKSLQPSLRDQSVRHVTYNTTHRGTVQHSVSNPAVDRLVPCSKSEISQQQHGGGVVSTQLGHAPVRAEAQDQTVIQCRQNDTLQQQKNRSRAALTEIVHEPGRSEAQGQTAVQCRQNENLQQQNSSGGVSTQVGHAPVRLEAQDQK